MLHHRTSGRYRPAVLLLARVVSRPKTPVPVRQCTAAASIPEYRRVGEGHDTHIIITCMARERTASTALDLGHIKSTSFQLGGHRKHGFQGAPDSLDALPGHVASTLMCSLADEGTGTGSPASRSPSMARCGILKHWSGATRENRHIDVLKEIGEEAAVSSRSSKPRLRWSTPLSSRLAQESSISFYFTAKLGSYGFVTRRMADAGRRSKPSREPAQIDSVSL